MSTTAQWEDLVDRSAEPCPWLRPGWVEAWWRAFGSGRLRFFTLHRGDRLAALAPLAQRRGAFVAPTNYHTPAFELVGEDDAAVRELAGEVFAARPRRVQARFLQPDAVTTTAVRDEAVAREYRVVERRLERSPFVSTELGWDHYLASLTGKLRRELRRRRRRLEEQGHVELVVEDGQRSLDELLAEGFRVEGSAWKDARGTAIASHHARRTFYSDVARWAAERDSLRLAFMRLDGRTLAFDFAIEEHGRHYLLKAGFDPAYRALSPGMLLRFEMLGRAFSLGMRSYEFLGTDEAWKLDWTSSVRERVELMVFAPTASGIVDWAANRYVRPLAVRALSRLGR
jgi:CelD/BcsL family acetyltransferase involved in cellulose biosynthesis